MYLTNAKLMAGEAVQHDLFSLSFTPKLTTRTDFVASPALAVKTGEK